jgi:hypothetical protein
MKLCTVNAGGSWDEMFRAPNPWVCCLDTARLWLRELGVGGALIDLEA